MVYWIYLFCSPKYFKNSCAATALATGITAVRATSQGRSLGRNRKVSSHVTRAGQCTVHARLIILQAGRNSQTRNTFNCYQCFYCMWYVYILLCSDKSLYTGSSNNPHKRFLTHKNGKGGKYTRSHKPLKIIYTEEMESKSHALKRESEIKSWSRNEKITLLNLKYIT